MRGGPAAAVLALALAASSARAPAAEAPDTHRYHAAGWGGPAVVVFEQGLGDRLETWQPVQAELSLFTRTFAYNRAGYEGSADSADPRDAATVVAELRALLARRGLPPPYVLVGHSLGGLFMQYFARNFPEEVAGLVLVDSSHWAQTERMQRESAALASDVLQARLRLTGTQGRETRAFDVSGHQVQDSPPLRAMPLVVLSASQFADPVARAATGSRVRARRGFDPEFWFGLQQELAAQLPDARHRVIADSGHFIQQQQPGEVTAAVRDLVLGLANPRVSRPAH